MSASFLWSTPVQDWDGKSAKKNRDKSFLISPSPTRFPLLFFLRTEQFTYTRMLTLFAGQGSSLLLNISIHMHLSHLGTICTPAVEVALCQMVWSRVEKVCVCLPHTTGTDPGMHQWSFPEVQHHKPAPSDCRGPWTQCPPREKKSHFKTQARTSSGLGELVWLY